MSRNGMIVQRESLEELLKHIKSSEVLVVPHMTMNGTPALLVHQKDEDEDFLIDDEGFHIILEDK
jgi:hypothetical protein